MKCQYHHSSKWLLTVLLICFFPINNTIANEIICIVGITEDTQPGTPPITGLMSLRQTVENENCFWVMFDPVTNGKKFILAYGQLDFTHNKMIVGNDDAKTIISGNNASRVININENVSVMLVHVTITEGYANTTDAGVLSDYDTLFEFNEASQKQGGGGIRNSGQLSMYYSTILNNQTKCTLIIGDDLNVCSFTGGGLLNIKGSTAFLYDVAIALNKAETGGAIFNYGNHLTIKNSAIIANFNAYNTQDMEDNFCSGNKFTSSAPVDSGNIDADIIIENTTFNNNVSCSSRSALDLLIGSNGSLYINSISIINNYTWDPEYGKDKIFWGGDTYSAFTIRLDNEAAKDKVTVVNSMIGQNYAHLTDEAYEHHTFSGMRVTLDSPGFEENYENPQFYLNAFHHNVFANSDVLFVVNDVNGNKVGTLDNTLPLALDELTFYDGWRVVRTPLINSIASSHVPAEKCLSADQQGHSRQGAKCSAGASEYSQIEDEGK